MKSLKSLFLCSFILLHFHICFSQEPKEGEFYSLRDKKMLSGIDFYAVGSKPDWSLDIDFEDTVLFKVNRLSIESQFSKSQFYANNKSLTYTLKADNKEIIILISAGKCRNKNTREVFEYKVAIESKNTKDRYTGCGNYLPDYRLNNIWVVKKLNQEELGNGGEGHNLPVVEFHLSEKTVMGNNSCNEFSGKISFKNGQIVFGKLLSEKKTCSKKNVKSTFLKALSGKTLFYKFEDGFLKLYNDNTEIMILKNID